LLRRPLGGDPRSPRRGERPGARAIPLGVRLGGRARRARGSGNARGGRPRRLPAGDVPGSRTAMKAQIPDDLAALYASASTRVRSHAALRWRTCPFEPVVERVPESGRILDVGCGHGLLAARLAMTSPRRRVLGIDVATDKI